MSQHQLTYEGRTYYFDTLIEEQEFLDKLPPGAEVKMDDAPLLLQLLNAPGAPLNNWREINKAICDEFSGATEDHRISLLGAFKSTMDIAETTITPESLDIFRNARDQQYKSMIYQEALVGENICMETLDAVTLREVAAGRMSPDYSCRKLAIQGMAEQHFTRAELMAMVPAKQESVSTSKENAPKSIWRRALGWVRSKH